MKKESLLEIVKRLYTAYNHKIVGRYKISGDEYDFTVIFTSSNIVLIETRKGDWNTINPIVKSIPFLQLLKNNNIQFNMNL